MSINVLGLFHLSDTTLPDGSKTIASRRPSFGDPGDKDGGVTGFRNRLKRAVNVAYRGRFGLLRAKDEIRNAISDRQTAILYKKFASAFKNQIRKLDSKQSPNFADLKVKSREEYRQFGQTQLETAKTKLLTAEQKLQRVLGKNIVDTMDLDENKEKLANAVAYLKLLDLARTGKDGEFADPRQLQDAKQNLKVAIAALAKNVAKATFAQKVYTRTEARLVRAVEQAEKRVAYAEKQLVKINQATEVVVAAVPAENNPAEVAAKVVAPKNALLNQPANVITRRHSVSDISPATSNPAKLARSL